MHALSSTLALWGLSTQVDACGAATPCPVADVSIIANTGTPVGREEVHDGGKPVIPINRDMSVTAGLTNAKVNLYITGNKSDTAVLYLTDVYGINLTQNKLSVSPRGFWLV